MVHPENLSPEAFDYLLSRGWYPMRQAIFTTSHIESPEGQVRQVHWLRYPVAEITQRQSHRRIRRRNGEFSVELLDPFTHSDELDELYSRYLDSVDFDGYPTIAAASLNPGEANIYSSRAFLVRDNQRIIACGLFHQGDRALASILHFYDPGYRNYSLGKYLILLTVDYCRNNGISWYYPGYVIRQDGRMDYKLFLGRGLAQYYDPAPHPMNGTWRKFEQSILD